MSTLASPVAPLSRRRVLLGAGLLLCIELALIGGVFKHGIAFSCLDNWPVWACSGASGTLIALYCVIGVAALFWVLRPAPVHHLLMDAGSHIWPLLVNAVGFVTCMVPILMLNKATGADMLWAAFAFWALGMSALLGGFALYLAPLPRWHAFIKAQWTTLLPILVAGACAPLLATQIRPIWRIETVAQITFDAVSFVMRVLGYAVETPPGTKIIGTDAFAINIAPVCSGVEGIALVAIFTSIYLWLFRATLKFPQALLLFPLGFAASALFNVVRISALLVIGLEGNPELAVGGFHSHAGWLMFTLVALGIVALAQTVPTLQKTPVQSATFRAPPLRHDPMAAQILPFAVFMLSALLASALAENPGVVYPLRVMAMGAAVAMFIPLYRRLPWRLDPVACGIGLAIGALWVLVPVEIAEPYTAPYGALSGAALILWFVMRGLGTIVFVPVIEEMFFRGYLEKKLRFGSGLGWSLLAAVITATAFAALHDRWVEAFIASLAFSWILHRHGRVSDAVISHACANAVVFACAVLTGNLHII